VGLALTARAKINLHLDVVSERDDGYHDIATLFHSIELADLLELAPAEGLSLTVEPPMALPDEENLAWLAARELGEEAWTLAEGAPLPMGLAIRVAKRIRRAAGLGGGSADAAATLVGANEIWGLGWPAARLSTVASGLGADVPFMIGGGAAIGRGRGDELEPIAPWAGLGVVLALPEAHLATVDVYARTSSEGSASPVEETAAALSSRDLTALGAAMRNDLTDAAIHFVPEIRQALQIASASSVPAMMSGSGPAVFALSDDAERLDRVDAQWRAAGLPTLRTRLAASGVTRAPGTGPAAGPEAGAHA
jgi:4-diphosphocytidyl-2-C-methyl-D-erythritol kinase